jgi:Tfp pilus assembly protein PilO
VNLDLAALWASVRRWHAGHSERDRRILLGVAVAVVLSVIYVAVIEPVRNYRRRLAEDIAEGQEQLERSARFVGALDTLRAERVELRKRFEQAKTRLLPGGSGTLGAAALQERANSIAAEKGITVQSVQVMKEEVVQPFHRVAVRLTLQGDVKALADFAAAVEYQQQLIIPFVEMSRRGAVAGAKGPRTIQATVEVAGYVLESGKEGMPGEGEGEPGTAASAEGAHIEPPANEAPRTPEAS